MYIYIHIYYIQFKKEKEIHKESPDTLKTL